VPLLGLPRALCYALVAALVLVCGRARAGIEHIKLDFSVASSETPYALCVLSQRPSPTAVSVSLLGPDQGRTVRFASVTPDQLKAAQDELDKKEAQTCGEQKAGRERAWSDCVTRFATAKHALAEALGGRGPPAAAGPKLGADAALCEPQFSLPKPAEAIAVGAKPPEWFMTCAVNQQHVDNRNVALLRLEPPPARPGAAAGPGASRVGVSELYMDGTVASLALAGSLDNGDYVVMTVVGGDYLTRGSEYNTPDGRVHLPLRARCGEQHLAIPDGMRSRVQLTLKRTGVEIAKPVTQDVVEGQVTVVLPRQEGEYSLSASDEPNVDLSSAPAATAEAYWQGDVTPVLHSTSLSFTWARNCLYGKQPRPDDLTSWCPAAELVEVSATCSATKLGMHDGCQYTCATSNGDAMRLPVRIRFRGHSPEEIWTDIVLRQRQELDGYVPPELRRIRLNRYWFTSRAEADVRHVELTDGLGQVHRVPLRADWAPVPGVGCYDSFTVKPIGTKWAYEEEESVGLTDGALTLPDPTDKADVGAGGFAVHAGGSALFQDKMHLDSPWVDASVLGRVRPLGRDVAFEGRLGLLLSRRPYWTRYSSSGVALADAQRETHASWYIHAATELHVVWWASDGLALAPFIGPSLGHPTPASHDRLVGGFDLSMTAGLSSRHVLSPKWCLEFLLRGFWFEETNVFDVDFRGQVTKQELRRHGWEALAPRFGMLGVGLRFGDH